MPEVVRGVEIQEGAIPFTLPTFDALKRHLAEKSESVTPLQTFLPKEYACRPCLTYSLARALAITGIPSGFHGAASVYYCCDDMPSVVFDKYQWDAS